MGNCIDIVNTNTGGGCTVTYSCIEQAGYAGSNGNISSDPLFLDAANGDFRLTSASPCIDAGDGDTAPTLDFDGNTRFDDPDVINTGTGDPAYSDMGAYESSIITFVENSQLESIKIYPNPTNGIFTISGEGIQQIEVYNIHGRLIYSSKNNFTNKTNLGQQVKGLYLIKIEKGNKLINKKIIIN